MIHHLLQIPTQVVRHLYPIMALAYYLTPHLLELEPMQVGKAPQLSTNHPADTTILRHCVRPLLPRDRQRLSLSRDFRLKRHWRPSIWHLARTNAIRICRYRTSSLRYESCQTLELRLTWYKRPIWLC